MSNHLDPNKRQQSVMDLDPNGTNFIIVDPDDETFKGSSEYTSRSCNQLMIEIARKLTAERPSIAIKTGKSQSSPFGTNLSGIEVALANTEVGTPLLLLDLTKRPVMPTRLLENMLSFSGQSMIKPAVAVTHPLDENAGPAARRRQIDWYMDQVEKEQARLEEA
jgi:hypothetical protein